MIFWNGEIFHLDNPVFGIIVLSEGGVWLRPSGHLGVRCSRVSVVRWVCLVPFGKCLANFLMGFVFRLRQDKIEIDSSCEADCGEDQETVGI